MAKTTPKPTKRLGRPKSAEKRAAIMKAGAELFFSEGWEGASMDAIAKRAGVSKQTAYSHFSSKEDLLRSCIHHRMELYDMESDAFEAKDLESALAEYATRYLAMINDPNVVGMYRLIIGIAGKFPDLAKTFYELGPLAGRQVVVRLIGKWWPPLKLSDEDEQLRAEQFLGLVREAFFEGRLIGVRGELTDLEIKTHAQFAARAFIQTRHP